MLVSVQVVGYATKFLNLAPDLAVLRDPVVVAGVVGFFQARGLAPMTIKLRVQHITQGSSFVPTRFCPKARAYTVETAEETALINNWFKRLSAKVLEEAQRQPKKLYCVDLWEAWDFATYDWVDFVQEFQVSACGTPLTVPPPATHHCSVLLAGQQLQVDQAAGQEVPDCGVEADPVWCLPASHQGRCSESAHGQDTLGS